MEARLLLLLKRKLEITGINEIKRGGKTDMMTLEEALAAAPAETVTANDYLVIDPETRKINVPDTEKLFGVRKELNVERKWFKCPKIVGDNIDLSKCSIFVNYIPAKMDGRYEEHEIPGSYLCEDVVEDGENIRFSWLISSNVTRKSGIIAFSVCAKAADDAGRLVTRWHTTAALGEIFDTIQTGEIEEIKDYDLIIQLLNKVEQLNETVEDYKNEIGNIKPAKASKVLWEGKLSSGSSIEFYIPKECFYANPREDALGMGITLVLVFEEHLFDTFSDNTAVVSMYRDWKNYQSAAYEAYFYDGVEDYNTDKGYTKMRISRLNTVEFAKCKIDLSYKHYKFLRCVYAITPEFLEVKNNV